MVWPFARLSASVTHKGVRRGLRHRARAVKGASWIPRELVCGAVVRGLGWCMGLRCPSWVACVPHAQPVFPPCCWPSFRDGPIASLVAPALMGVALPEVAVVFVLIWVLLIGF
ncbi:hypothetical protein TIFTF001_001709 [Ficus carica]|uniref:Uncharacterized protein n=1 Tax=Ficus carica TaxID=3494 RepID=A0AA87Z2T9_FICCA|nr:hypothetical protein TIFTF001_001709 [Ficus carica]